MRSFKELRSSYVSCLSRYQCISHHKGPYPKIHMLGHEVMFHACIDTSGIFYQIPLKSQSHRSGRQVGPSCEAERKSADAVRVRGTVEDAWQPSSNVKT